MTNELSCLLEVLVAGLQNTAFLILPENVAKVLTAMTFPFYLGMLAAAIQAWAYVLYIRDDNIDPNPTTWFMFAYGTGLLAIMAWQTSATIAELILPTICSIFSIYISARCWWRAVKADPTRLWPRGWWPDDFWEKVSFVLDIIITLIYVTASVLGESSILTKEQRYWAVLVSLFLSNVSTFIQFYPILRETYLHPDRENSKPWAVWAGAYGTLAMVTYMQHGEIWHHLMFYPLSSCFLHLLMAWFARPKRQKEVLEGQKKSLANA